MINIAKLLKNCPKGTKLYSPIIGEVEFVEVINTSSMPIRVEGQGFRLSFDAYGRYMGNDYPDSECLLFPSKDCRTWENFKLPVQPNFKVGNWIICNNGSSDVPIQIYGLKKDRYLVTNLLGSKGELMISRQDEWHIWTIEDAKPGDVLIDGTTDTIGIFKEINETRWYSKIYCGNVTWGPVFSNGGLHKIKGTKPATKEQQDLLVAKLKEAGYEWNDEKKEWRKIKPHYDISNFHAGMPVLVRDGDCGEWRYILFSHYRRLGTPFAAGGQFWFQCIPFNEDTKHLVGTTDMPNEEYINW